MDRRTSSPDFLSETGSIDIAAQSVLQALGADASSPEVSGAVAQGVSDPTCTTASSLRYTPDFVSDVSQELETLLTWSPRLEAGAANRARKSTLRRSAGQHFIKSLKNGRLEDAFQAARPRVPKEQRSVVEAVPMQPVSPKEPRPQNGSPRKPPRISKENICLDGRAPEALAVASTTAVESANSVAVAERCQATQESQLVDTLASEIAAFELIDIVTGLHDNEAKELQARALNALALASLDGRFDNISLFSAEESRNEEHVLHTRVFEKEILDEIKFDATVANCVACDQKGDCMNSAIELGAQALGAFALSSLDGRLDKTWLENSTRDIAVISPLEVKQNERTEVSSFGNESGQTSHDGHGCCQDAAIDLRTRAMNAFVLASVDERIDKWLSNSSDRSPTGIELAPRDCENAIPSDMEGNSNEVIRRAHGEVESNPNSEAEIRDRTLNILTLACVDGRLEGISPKGPTGLPVEESISYPGVGDSSWAQSIIAAAVGAAIVEEAGAADLATKVAVRRRACSDIIKAFASGRFEQAVQAARPSRDTDLERCHDSVSEVTIRALKSLCLGTVDGRLVKISPQVSASKLDPCANEAELVQQLAHADMTLDAPLTVGDLSQPAVWESQACATRTDTAIKRDLSKDLSDISISRPCSPNMDDVMDLKDRALRQLDDNRSEGWIDQVFDQLFSTTKGRDSPSLWSERIEDPKVRSATPTEIIELRATVLGELIAACDEGRFERLEVGLHDFLVGINPRASSPTLSEIMELRSQAQQAVTSVVTAPEGGGCLLQMVEGPIQPILPGGVALALDATINLQQLALHELTVACDDGRLESMCVNLAAAGGLQNPEGTTGSPLQNTNITPKDLSGCFDKLFDPQSAGAVQPIGQGTSDGAPSKEVLESTNEKASGKVILNTAARLLNTFALSIEDGRLETLIHSLQESIDEGSPTCEVYQPYEGRNSRADDFCVEGTSNRTDMPAKLLHTFALAIEDQRLEALLHIRSRGGEQPAPYDEQHSKDVQGCRLYGSTLDDGPKDFDASAKLLQVLALANEDQRLEVMLQSGRRRDAEGFVPCDGHQPDAVQEMSVRDSMFESELGGAGTSAKLLNIFALANEDRRLEAVLSSGRNCHDEGSAPCGLQHPEDAQDNRACYSRLDSASDGLDMSAEQLLLNALSLADEAESGSNGTDMSAKLLNTFALANEDHRLEAVLSRGENHKGEELVAPIDVHQPVEMQVGSANHLKLGSAPGELDMSAEPVLLNTYASASVDEHDGLASLTETSAKLLSTLALANEDHRLEVVLSRGKNHKGEELAAPIDVHQPVEMQVCSTNYLKLGSASGELDMSAEPVLLNTYASASVDEHDGLASLTETSAKLLSTLALANEDHRLEALLFTSRSCRCESGSAGIETAAKLLNTFALASEDQRLEAFLDRESCDLSKSDVQGIGGGDSRQTSGLEEFETSAKFLKTLALANEDRRLEVVLQSGGSRNGDGCVPCDLHQADDVQDIYVCDSILKGGSEEINMHAKLLSTFALACEDQRLDAVLHKGRSRSGDEVENCALYQPDDVRSIPVCDSVLKGAADETDMTAKLLSTFALASEDQRLELIVHNCRSGEGYASCDLFRPEDEQDIRISDSALGVRSYEADEAGKGAFHSPSRTTKTDADGWNMRLPPDVASTSASSSPLKCRRSYHRPHSEASTAAPSASASPASPFSGLPSVCSPVQTRPTHMRPHGRFSGGQRYSGATSANISGVLVPGMSARPCSTPGIGARGELPAVWSTMARSFTPGVPARTETPSSAIPSGDLPSLAIAPRALQDRFEAASASPLMPWQILRADTAESASPLLPWQTLRRDTAASASPLLPWQTQRAHTTASASPLLPWQTLRADTATPTPQRPNTVMGLGSGYARTQRNSNPREWTDRPGTAPTDEASAKPCTAEMANRPPSSAFGWASRPGTAPTGESSITPSSLYKPSNSMLGWTSRPGTAPTDETSCRPSTQSGFVDMPGTAPTENISIKSLGVRNGGVAERAATLGAASNLGVDDRILQNGNVPMVSGGFRTPASKGPAAERIPDGHKDADGHLPPVEVYKRHIQEQAKLNARDRMLTHRPRPKPDPQQEQAFMGFKFELTITNLEYDKLVENTSLVSKTKASICAAVAKGAGSNIKERNVDVKLLDGSVKAEVTMSFLVGVYDPDVIQKKISQSSFAASVASEVAKVPGISAVSIGRIAVSLTSGPEVIPSSVLDAAKADAWKKPEDWLEELRNSDSVLSRLVAAFDGPPGSRRRLAWRPQRYLTARNEAVENNDLVTLNRLVQFVRSYTEQAIAKVEYTIDHANSAEAQRHCSLCALQEEGSASNFEFTIKSLRGVSAPVPRVEWFGRRNANQFSVADEIKFNQEAAAVDDNAIAPLVFSDRSPLDLVQAIRAVPGGKDTPIVLICEATHFDRSGGIDMENMNAMTPNDLLLRSDFARFARYAQDVLDRSGNTTMRQHLTADHDSCVFRCPGVTVFRGPHDEGYPFLEEPMQVHVVVMAMANQKPRVLTLEMKKRIIIDWYENQEDHAALTERLNLVGVVAMQEVVGVSEGEAGKKPIVIMTAPGCGTGYWQPREAVANELTAWRRQFSSFFDSVYVCCSNRAGGDAELCAVLDPIVNRSFKKAAKKGPASLWNQDMVEVMNAKEGKMKRDKYSEYDEVKDRLGKAQNNKDDVGPVFSFKVSEINTDWQDEDVTPLATPMSNIVSGMSPAASRMGSFCSTTGDAMTRTFSGAEDESLEEEADSTFRTSDLIQMTKNKVLGEMMRSGVALKEIRKSKQTSKSPRSPRTPSTKKQNTDLQADVDTKDSHIEEEAKADEAEKASVREWFQDDGQVFDRSQSERKRTSSCHDLGVRVLSTASSPPAPGRQRRHSAQVGGRRASQENIALKARMLREGLQDFSALNNHQALGRGGLPGLQANQGRTYSCEGSRRSSVAVGDDDEQSPEQARLREEFRKQLLTKKQDEGNRCGRAEATDPPEETKGKRLGSKNPYKYNTTGSVQLAGDREAERTKERDREAEEGNRRPFRQKPQALDGDSEFGTAVYESEGVTASPTNLLPPANRSKKRQNSHLTLKNLANMNIAAQRIGTKEPAEGPRRLTHMPGDINGDKVFACPQCGSEDDVVSDCVQCGLRRQARQASPLRTLSEHQRQDEVAEAAQEAALQVAKNVKRKTSNAGSSLGNISPTSPDAQARRPSSTFAR